MRSLLFAVLLSLFLFPAQVFGDASDAAYVKARENYTRLVDSPRKKLHRDQWEGVIRSFEAVTEKYPQGTHGADGLFMAARATRELYDVSRNPGDAGAAVRLFEQVAESYPASSLADDALFAAGGIYETLLEQKDLAYLRYQAVVERYPEGDMLPRARSRAVALIAFAPPAPPVDVAPVASAPAKSAELPAPSPATAPVPAEAGVAQLNGLRYWSKPGYTRVVLDLAGQPEFSTNVLPADAKNGLPPRIYLDIKKVSPAANLVEQIKVEDGLLRQVRAARFDPTTMRVVLDLVAYHSYKTFTLPDPYRIVIDVYGDAQAMLSAAPGPELRALSPPEKKPVAPPAKILPPVVHKPVKVPRKAPAPVPVEGLRRIVVDAGHGGKDPGAIGPSGLQEKQVTLSIAKLLKSELERELGCEVILTRDRDVFLPLEERTAIANKVGADLFISVHANASHNKSAYGVETYYLNFSKNDKAAAVAARENGTSLKQVGDLELILFDLMANAKINESSRLAAEIQNALVRDLKGHYPDIRDLGVKQGPFYVLVGATMPSVLVEAAFISHKREETRLASRDFQQETSAAIVKGVRNYASALRQVAGR
ncbi:N-acetylmuramoyl-L-alanine amidase [Trichloromonas sp.]|uniref:N-acetylmuramoyl-L-alanine amidase n=1 Tax=Trichloromonas sp. TaxID=3069249 RepID=UPI002A416CB4|nr:N-acetylmuramoyl-L-alanine amidase [Trichloromonas sp.]